MLTRSTWNNVSCHQVAVKENLADSLAYAVRILDSDFVNRATEAASYLVLLP